MSQVVPFLDAVDRQWKALAQDMPSSVQTLDVRLSREHQKLCIELSWPGHVASITAWENAICLDVDVVEIESKKGLIFVAGPCEDRNDARSRLLRFRDYIQTSLSPSGGIASGERT